MKSKLATAGTTILALSAITPAAIATATESSTPKPKAGPMTVKVQDDYYNPARLKVAKGATVKWVWGHMDYNSHNVTLSKGPKGILATAWTSPTASGSYTFKRKFVTPGTYHFYCTIHPTSMFMTVVVTK